MTCPVRSLSRYRGISDLGRCTFLSVDSTALIRCCALNCALLFCCSSDFFQRSIAPKNNPDGNVRILF